MPYLPVGQRLKRKFHDFQEVEVVGHTNDCIIIKDSTGTHPVSISKIDEFFTILEPDAPKDSKDT